MAIRYELRTFKDIVDAIMEACQIQASDAVERNRIKRNVQQVYQHEVLPYKQWHWLRGTANLQTEPFFGTGTAAVTSGSCEVQLSETLIASRRDYYFSVDGSNVKYRILAHAGSTGLLTLEVPFGESTHPAIHFRIWSESLPLPNDLDEVIELRHGHHRSPVTPLGLQEIRRLEATGSKAEGHPAYYTTTDFKDPEGYTTVAGLPSLLTRASNGLTKTLRFSASPGASESVALVRPGDQIEVVVPGADGYRYNGRATVSRLSTTALTNDTISYTGRFNWIESATSDSSIVMKKLETEGYDRCRELIIYPSIFNARVGLELDYIKQVIPLESDADEPAIPARDRIVLYYGALYHTWTRKRNPEEAAAARQLFQAKLDKMAGKTEDSPDKPQMVPSKLYMGAKRSGQRLRSRNGGINFGSSGSTTAPTGTSSRVAVYASDSTLQSSSITTLELDALDSIDGNIQDQIDAIKLDPAAGDLVVVSNPDGTFDESTITETQLEWLAAADRGSVLFPDASSTTTWLSVPHATYRSLFVWASLQRGAGNSAAVQLLVSTDGSTTAVAEARGEQGALGVTFSAAISGPNLLLQYATTATGTAVTGGYRLQKI